MSWTHPEQRAGELYMGNISPHDFDWRITGWVSKRIGSVAYAADSQPLRQPGFGEDYRPWFIEAREVEAAIRTAETLGGPNSDEKILTYRAMLRKRS